MAADSDAVMVPSSKPALTRKRLLSLWILVCVGVIALLLFPIRFGLLRMLLLAGILPSVTGVGVLTGAAPNPVLVNFLTAAGEPFSSSCLLVRIAKWIAPPPDEPRWLNLELTENKLTRS